MERTRKGYEVFLPFLDGHEKEVEEGREITVEVRDMQDFSKKIVKAKISKSSDQLPNGEELWVKDAKENILQEPWKIEIIEELDEETPVSRSEIEERKEFYGGALSRWHAQQKMKKLEEEKKRMVKNG